MKVKTVWSDDKIKREIKRILIKVMILKDLEPSEIGDEEPLFALPPTLIPDRLLELISEIERVFGIRFEDEDISEEMFLSVNNLARRIKELLRSPSSHPSTGEG